MRRASYAEICDWMVKRWDKVTPDCIQNGFRRALLHNYDEDEESESDDEEEAADLQNLPESLLEDLEKFHIISDDEFDGF